MRALLSALMLMLPAAGFTQAQSGSAPAPDRVAGWRSDLGFWLAKLREQHYVYKSKPLPASLTSAARELSANIPRFSDERVLFEFQRLAAHIGDGHTYVLPLGAERVHGSMLPIRFYLFSDGLFVVDAQPGFEKWIGTQLVSIGNTSAQGLLAAMKPTISADNPFGYRWIGPPFLNLRGALESIASGVDADSIRVTLRDRGGTLHKIRLATVPPPRMQGVPKLLASRATGAPAPPLWLRRVEKNFWMQPLDSATLYVQFNQVANEDGYTLKQAGADLDAQLRSGRPWKIILDVRHNNGGNSYLYPPIIDALSSWEKLNPRGTLYVLMGRNTFSAAQNFISQLDRRTRAIFVGEPSSSKPNFVGEENNFQLPWSGAIVSISNRYHENIPGDKRQWIAPDISVTLSSRDYFASRDPVLTRVWRPEPISAP